MRQVEGPAGPEQAGVLGPRPGPGGALAGDALHGGQRQLWRQKSAVPALFINQMWCHRLGPSEGQSTTTGRFAVPER